VLNIFRDNEVFYTNETVYAPGGTLGPRIQRNLQIVFIHEGEATIVINGQAHFIPSRHAAVLFPGKREHFLFSKTVMTHHSWIEAQEYLSPNQHIEDILRNLSAPIPFTDRMERILYLTMGLQHNNDLNKIFIKDHLAQALFYEVFAAADVSLLDAREQRKRPPAIHKACAFIDKHFQRSCTLDGIAQAAGMSPQHLTKLFHQFLGQTPIQYLWEKRTTSGLQLLKNTGLTIQEIAYQTGFKSPFHFSRLIKNRTMLSPKRVRRKEWMMPPDETKPDRVDN
jgi:AraC family transcriptional regulator of arabinose operon